MKITATSFKRSHACTAALSAPNPAAGHCWPTPLPETPGHSRQVWGSLLWGHCSFLLGPGVYKVLFVPSKSLCPQSCVSSGGCIVGLMVHSSTLAWQIPWTEEPGRLQSMGSQRVQHDWATSLSSKRAYVLPRSTTPRAPAPVSGHCWLVPLPETLKHSSGSVSVWSLGPGVHKVCLSPQSVFGGYGV